MNRLYLKGQEKWNKADVVYMIEGNVLPVFGLGSAPLWNIICRMD
jgi:hypothetical protein